MPTRETGHRGTVCSRRCAAGGTQPPASPGSSHAPGPTPGPGAPVQDHAPMSSSTSFLKPRAGPNPSVHHPGPRVPGLSGVI